jgi:glycoprotein-N-acetylgalactosamine 3-beta-galactosyltransferase
VANVTYIRSPVAERYKLLWLKVRHAWAHIALKYAGFGWYLKADDDSYIDVPSMRCALRGYSETDDLLIGRMNKHVPRQRWVSGGSGYVLSRRALSQLSTSIGKIGWMPPVCSKWVTRTLSDAEDLRVSQCLLFTGTRLVDFDRRLGLSIQAPTNTPDLTRVQEADILSRMALCRDCSRSRHCADSPIGFHYCTVEDMRRYAHVLRQ